MVTSGTVLYSDTLQSVSKGTKNITQQENLTYLSLS